MTRSTMNKAPRFGLNEVRPRRPEQYPCCPPYRSNYLDVSMKSGLEGRNNATRIGAVETILIQSQ